MTVSGLGVLDARSRLSLRTALPPLGAADVAARHGGPRILDGTPVAITGYLRLRLSGLASPTLGGRRLLPGRCRTLGNGLR